MARSLKVFSTPIGFFNAVVAAPSQKAALEAWGVRENLFATGLARQVDNPELVAKALARPGEIVRDPISSNAGFVAAAKAVPRPRDPRPAVAAARKAKARPRPDRAALDAAEARLKTLRIEQERETEALDQERAALEARAKASRKERDRKLQAAEDAVALAKTAFEVAAK